MVLAVAHPWASASFYLSSQSVADSRCNPHATPRSSYSRRSPSCRFFLCRAALLCLILQRHRLLSVPFCKKERKKTDNPKRKKTDNPREGQPKGTACAASNL